MKSTKSLQKYDINGHSPFFLYIVFHDYRIRVELQNRGPLSIIHQMSWLVWLVCSFAIHCRAKRATKYINLGLKAYQGLKLQPDGEINCNQCY